MLSRIESFVKLKIIVAYLLLIAMGGFAVWVVLVQVEALSKPDDAYERINERSSLVKTTLYYMYKSESDGLRLFLGDEEARSLYEKDLEVIYGSLQSLQEYASDSLQVARIDSIAALFSVKENTLASVVGGDDLSKYHKEIEKRIDSLRPAQDKLNNRLLAETKTKTRKDTIVTKRNSGNFFKRVKNVFKKTHSDSTVVTTANMEVDSVHVALADSINNVLGNLQREVAAFQQGALANRQVLWAKMNRENYKINTMIYRLIKNFEAEEMSVLLTEVSKKEADHDTTVRVLAGIAIAAIVVVLFFLWVIWRDLERSNRYKKELERLNQKNLALLDAREKLMLAITHDFKAPLSSIIGYTDLLNRIVEDRRQELYVSNIKTSSDLLLELVNDLLEFYKLDSDKAEVKSVQFDAHEFFDAIYRLFLPVAQGKNLELQRQFVFADDVVIESDPLKLKQIVNNLVTNAIKFTDAGSVTLMVDIDRDASEMVISVADTGRGISEEDKGKLFGMFVRVGSANGVPGFGLGLSIVDKTVRLLGGEISVKSEPGKGSCFTVKLPIEISEEPAVEKEVGQDDEVALASGCRILLVDDDDLQMNLVCEICKNNGIIADKCQYPTFVGQMIQDQQYDLVFTDIQMPSMSGFEVLDVVKKIRADLPVVAVTARSVDREEYERKGFFDVLTKPFKESDFLNVVRRVVKIDGKPIQEKEETGLNALFAFADGDSDAKRAILESFLEQTSENVAALKKSVDGSDEKSLMSLCHKMMPIFTMIGADKVVGILRKYEHDTSDYEMISEAELNVLLEEISKIVDDVKKIGNE